MEWHDAMNGDAPAQPARATRPQQASCNPWAVIGATAVVGLFLALLEASL